MGLRASILLAVGAVAVVLIVALIAGGFLYGLRPGRATLKNGSLEIFGVQFQAEHPASGCQNHRHLSIGSTEIDGWTVVGATGLWVAWHANVVQSDCNGDSRASDGIFFINLAANLDHTKNTTGPTAGVQQDVAVLRPGVFELSLDVGANSKNAQGGAAEVEVRVEQGGKTLATKPCLSTPTSSGINWTKCITPKFGAEQSTGVTNSLRIVIKGSANQGPKSFIGVDNVVLRVL